MGGARNEGQLGILGRLLTPLVTFCLRRGVGVRDFENVVRKVYVRVARDELLRAGGTPSTSRLSVITGIYRKDVDRILDEKDPVPSDSVSIFTRVIGQWEQSARFRTGNGRPRRLTCEGEESEFYRLVRSVSKNYHPSTVLSEMVRNGVVETSPRGASLIRRTVVVGGSEGEIYDIVARTVEHLLNCTEENISFTDGIGNLQHNTEFDNLSSKDLPRVKRWVLEEGRNFHKKLRNYLSRFDQDITPSTIPGENRGGGKIFIGTFSLTTPPTIESPPPPKKGR